MFRVRRSLIRRASRCLFVAVCCLAYLATAIGYPAAPASVKRSAVCQGRACGCSTVEQCQQACCCSRSALIEVTENPPASDEGGCCSGAKSAPVALPVNWVIGAHASQCQGQSLQWTAGGASLPPPAPVVVSDETPSDASVETVDLLPLAVGLAPPAPPPRLHRLLALASSTPTSALREPCAPVSTGGMLV